MMDDALVLTPVDWTAMERIARFYLAIGPGGGRDGDEEIRAARDLCRRILESA